jgi:predicted AAA+ superfamily ATPase
MVKRAIKLPSKGSYFLFGARGTGKTTLLKASYPDALFIDLLDYEEEDNLRRSPKSLRDRIAAVGKTQKIIIDEIQKLPRLLDEVQRLIDQGIDRFVLTGSSSRKLKRGGANLLGGRAFYKALFPFTAGELGERFNLQEALEYGLLPKIFQFDTRQAKIEFLNTYVRVYIQEEIQLEQIVRSLDPFRGFLEVAAQMNGKILNYSKIEREVGVSVKTVQSYYQILQDTYLGFMVSGFHESWRKQLSQSPRFYFFDTGVARALGRRVTLGLNPSSYEFGDLFEQFIVSECFKWNEYFGKNYHFTYLRTKDGAEIDLIVDRPGLRRAMVEIKSSEHITEKDLPHIITFKKEHPKTEAFCLSRDQRKKNIAGVTCLPWELGLIELGLGP